MWNAPSVRKHGGGLVHLDVITSHVPEEGRTRRQPMARFRIPVTFTVDAFVEVEADNHAGACEAAMRPPLPPRDQWEYLADSFAVRTEDPYEVFDPSGTWQSRER